MLVEDLILELQKVPAGTHVCIADWRKNVHYADDEPQGNGIYPDFEIEAITEEDANVPFIALSFVNEDYHENGAPNEESSIYSSIMKEWI